MNNKALEAASAELEVLPTHIEISHPSYFSQQIKDISVNLKCSAAGLAIVPQEGDYAGTPLPFRIGCNEEGADNGAGIQNYLLNSLEEGVVQGAVEIAKLEAEKIYIEPIAGRFGEPIGYIWLKECKTFSLQAIKELSEHIAATLEKSKKSRLHEVVASDFVSSGNTEDLINSLAKTIKNGLYCHSVAIWTKEDNKFRSFGVPNLDLLDSESLVKKAHTGEIVTVHSISDYDGLIYHRSSLNEMGIRSFFLIPVIDHVERQTLCVVGVFYKRKSGTTATDLELVKYVTQYFERLWVLHQKNDAMEKKLEFFDDILDFHEESIRCMTAFHEINSILQVLDTQVEHTKIVLKGNPITGEFLKIAAEKISRARFILGQHAETFATAGAIDDKIEVPTGDRVHKINIRSYIETYASAYDQRLTDIGASLRLDTQRLPNFIRIDVDHLELVIDNYVVNAIHALKHVTKGRRTIELAVSLEKKWIKITVRDNGPGIEPWMLSHVFTPNVTTRKAEGGRGLGLAIVWKLGRIHEHEPVIQSTWGDGASFTSWLKPVKIFE